jgi:hypothetical protein
MEDKEKRLQEIKLEMKYLIGNFNGDKEQDHLLADDLLCQALELFGQRELTKMFYDIDKWYS